MSPSISSDVTQAEGAKPVTVLVVPCYNEGARLVAGPFLDLVARGGFHVVFVNDGSTDDTREVIERIVREAPNCFSLLELRPNRGKAEAVRVGILWALNEIPARYVGYWDADLATPLDAALRFVDFLDRHPACQAAFGSRVQLLGRSIERSALRHYVGRVFATAASSFVLRIPVYDTQCGAKLFRVSEWLRSVFTAPFLSRWVFDVEIIDRMLAGTRAKASELLCEIPLHSWKDVPGSKVRARDLLSALIDLLEIRRLRSATWRPRSIAPSRWGWAFGALLLLAALVPRLWVLERDAVDWDEIFSSRVVQLPFAEGLEKVRYDAAHPPFYYGVLWVSIGLLGDGAVPMRLPSLLAGTALVGVAIAFGVRAGGAAVGILAGILVAISHQQIFYSAHGRSYAIYALLVLLLYWTCVRACREPDERANWAIFASACVIATLTHYMAWLYVLVTFPVALAARGRRAAISWMASVGIAGVFSAAWVALVIPALRAKGGLGVNLGWVVTPRLYDLVATYANYGGLPPIARGTTVSLALGLGLIASAVHALWRADRSGGSGAWIFLAIGGAIVPPMLLFILASPSIGLPFFGSRHLLPSQACWAVATAVGAWHCFGKSRVPRALVLTAALACAAAAFPAVLMHPLHQPFHHVAARLSEPQIARLPVFAMGENVEAPVNFYRQGEEPVQILARNESAARMPARFVALYRKKDHRELDRLASLSGKWNRREIDYIARDPTDPWGVTIAVVERVAEP
jgi:glycosyltransferase involved in cell wall biosynthesis